MPGHTLPPLTKLFPTTSILLSALNSCFPEDPWGAALHYLYRYASLMLQNFKQGDLGVLHVIHGSELKILPAAL